MGYEIINRLQQQDQKDILLPLQNAVNSGDKKKDSPVNVCGWETCSGSRKGFSLNIRQFKTC